MSMHNKCFGDIRRDRWSDWMTAAGRSMISRGMPADRVGYYTDGAGDADGRDTPSIYAKRCCGYEGIAALD